MMPRAKLLGDRQPIDVAAHHTPYLSPSRFSLYAQCPALYKRRYVDKIKDPPTIDMEYGSAIHAGLEAAFKGGDGELTFMRDLKRRLEPLVALGADPAEWLVPQGLALMTSVARLGWSGESELKFSWTCTGFVVPIHGIIDLWIPAERVVVDWKTTQHPWSDATTERYAFQRAIYTQAKIEEVQDLVTLRFVALGAYPGGRLQIIEATPNPVDVYRILEKARMIATQIEAESWACACRDGRHITEAA